jgi:RNA polymerase sigma-70 factor (ECF subfamily)
MDETNTLNKLDNENLLVEQAKTNDDAFTALYDFYLPKIYSFIFKRIGQKEITEDIVSATFIKVFTGLKSFKSNHNNSFCAWVYRIANNNLIDYYRKHGRQIVIDISRIKEPADESQDLQADFEFQANRVAVAKTMARLPEKDRKIIQLKFFAELDNGEIAKVMGLTPNNIGVLAYRAIKKFQTLHIKI